MLKQPEVYIDGTFYPKDKASISVFDHTFLYGDGIFEGIRVYNGRIFKCDEHIDRLYASAQSIALNIPLSKGEMIQAVIRTVRRNKFKDCSQSQTNGCDVCACIISMPKQRAKGRHF